MLKLNRHGCEVSAWILNIDNLNNNPTPSVWQRKEIVMDADGTLTWSESFDLLFGKFKSLLSLYLWISIGVQILLTWLMARTLNQIFGWHWAAYMWAGTIMALLLGWTRWITWWFAVIRFNYAVAWEAYLGRRETYNRNTEAGVTALTTISPSKTLRVSFGPCVVGINPFLGIVRDKAINLTRAQTIGGDNLELVTADNIPIDADWKIFATAIKDEPGISCLVQHSEQFTEHFLTQLAKSFLEQTARTMKLDEIFHGLYVDDSGRVTMVQGANLGAGGRGQSTTTLENRFAGFLGGRSSLHPTEVGIGRYTNEPMLTIRLKPTLIAALQAQRIAVSSAAAIKTYSDTGVDPDVAANLDATNRGKPAPATVTKIIVPDGVRDIHFIGDARNRGGGS